MTKLILQISVLQYFLETAGSMDHQNVLRLAFKTKKNLATVLTVLANREGWPVAGDLVPQEAPDNS